MIVCSLGFEIRRVHTIVCEVDFESFGISQKETESLDKSLKEGESKRVYLDVE